MKLLEHFSRAAWLGSIFFSCINSTVDARSSSNSTCCPSSSYKGEPKVGPLIQVTGLSRLPPNLVCLNLNEPSKALTGYTWYSDVAFDAQIAVNPKNPKNIIIVAQQDVLTNASTNKSLPLAIIAMYTIDGGQTWNESDLVLSRCQGATLYQQSDNFQSAFFPSVSFDGDGNCYVLSSSYNLFAANHQPTVNTLEGNIVAKSTDGGASWTRVSAATRDDGMCHFLDFPRIKADPYRDNTVYIVSDDLKCLVKGTCTDPNFNGTQNITFQKSVDGGFSWTPPAILASFPPDNTTECTPTPFAVQLGVLPNHKHTLLVSSMIAENPSDDVDGTAFNRVLAWRSKNGGRTWTKSTVASGVSQALPFDPATSDPKLPFTDLPSKDMAVSECNGNVYIVYADPQFNPNGEAGCVIKMSRDGGKTWSKPQPINPKTVDVQTFIPAVAVAKDGTVAVLFYDFRHFKDGDPALKTDVWVSFFDKNLAYKGEVRLTPKSFDARKSIRGFNGIDLPNCIFDYYIAQIAGLEAVGNDFVASFTFTNDLCEVVRHGNWPCDAFSVITQACNRQNIAFVHIKRH
jgi:hypothetical protein